MQPIPKEIIELAQEGGWERPSFFALNVDTVIADLEDAHTVLDRDFWIAIGKVKGWKKDYFEGETKRVNFSTGKSDWLSGELYIEGCPSHYRNRFYNLVYDQQPTDAFWEEIFKV